MRRLACAFLLLAVAATAGGPRVVFLSRRDNAERSALYVMDADGKGVRRLVEAKRYVIHFECSPAGGRVAYVCDPTDVENFELKILDVDSGSEKDVPSGIRWFPRWSPDGRRLAFMRYGFTWRVRATEPDRLESKVVGQAPPVDARSGDLPRDGAPSWSSDGKSIVFMSNRDGNLELYVAEVDGKTVRRLTSTKEAETAPRTSPDGARVAFLRGKDVWVMRLDGTEERNVSDQKADDYGAAWSPDGTRLAFVSERLGKPEVLVADLTTGKTANLTRHAAADRSPAWSPDGSRILFVSDRDGNEEIYVMNADGSNVRRLTRHSARDYSPEWLPAVAKKR